MTISFTQDVTMMETRAWPPEGASGTGYSSAQEHRASVLPFLR